MCTIETSSQLQHFRTEEGVPGAPTAELPAEDISCFVLCIPYEQRQNWCICRFHCIPGNASDDLERWI